MSETGVITKEFVPNPAYRPSAMAMGWRTPKSDLEEVLQRCAAGQVGDSYLYSTFAGADVWVFDRPEGGLHVVTLDDDSQAVYAFTDEELCRATGWTMTRSMQGRDLTFSLGPDGKVLPNPGLQPAASLRSGDVA